MTSGIDDIRLGADIGGTFTDIALEFRGTLFSTKVLTNYAAPEQAILDGIAVVTRDAGISASEIGIIIHGTTLATNALIEIGMFSLRERISRARRSCAGLV